MSLDTLPQELLAEVFSLDNGLSRRDLKSLRLTCRQVSTEASRSLFYQVRVSPLIQDFQHFFELSESPLASLVRVLVWEELAFDSKIFKYPCLKPPVVCDYSTADNEDSFTELTRLVYFGFLVGLQDISGFPRQPGPFTAHTIHDNKRPITKINSPDEFVSAVRNNMPNLHTLVSRPMDGQRCLEIPSLGFSMTISSLRILLEKHEINLSYNTGFMDYFIPLLESLASQANDEAPTPKISHLFYSDESLDNHSALLRMGEPLKLNIFEHLVHFDLCLCTSGDGIDNDGDDYGGDYDSNDDDSDDGDSDSSLSGGKTDERLNEQEVLAYVNRTDYPGQRKPLPPHIGEETQVSTHPLVFDKTTCELSAFHATRDNLWQKRGYDLKDIKALDSATFERRDEHGIAHSLGPRRIYHFETGLWVDSDKFFYDPVTDEEVDDPFEKREKPNDDSWTVQGQHTWNSEMGLWRDGQGKLKKFATERELPERPKVTTEDQDPDFTTDMQPFYDKEDEYLLRIEKAPRWDWGRETKGQVWYWQVSGTADHATEMWRFEHNGEYAYGNEPLEFWDDWYDDPGDNAEATPYGWNLITFARSMELGSEIPQSSTCEGLGLYFMEDDPICTDYDFHYSLPKPMDFEIWSKESWWSE
ncbi:hypothetical protein FANTH_14364 [Fusarium anthophilum]|uniref:F-box domain-containing protein n=1 Tax=Fusarium anthophilum TaxID=48485 RepID=A0A8H5DMU2_9HYPO|nr:hypothetical protein FANTH_14364 [Fusarium anthophilum]